MSPLESLREEAASTGGGALPPLASYFSQPAAPAPAPAPAAAPVQSAPPAGWAPQPFYDLGVMVEGGGNMQAPSFNKSDFQYYDAQGAPTMTRSAGGGDSGTWEEIVANPNYRSAGYYLTPEARARLGDQWTKNRPDSISWGGGFGGDDVGQSFDDFFNFSAGRIPQGLQSRGVYEGDNLVGTEYGTWEGGGDNPTWKRWDEGFLSEKDAIDKQFNDFWNRESFMGAVKTADKQGTAIGWKRVGDSFVPVGKSDPFSWDTNPDHTQAALALASMVSMGLAAPGMLAAAGSNILGQAAVGASFLNGATMGKIPGLNTAGALGSLYTGGAGLINNFGANLGTVANIGKVGGALGTLTGNDNLAKYGSITSGVAGGLNGALNGSDPLTQIGGGLSAASGIYRALGGSRDIDPALRAQPSSPGGASAAPAPQGSPGTASSGWVNPLAGMPAVARPQSNPGSALPSAAPSAPQGNYDMWNSMYGGGFGGFGGGMGYGNPFMGFGGMGGYGGGMGPLGMYGQQNFGYNPYQFGGMGMGMMGGGGMGGMYGGGMPFMPPPRQNFGGYSQPAQNFWYPGQQSQQPQPQPQAQPQAQAQLQAMPDGMMSNHEFRGQLPSGPTPKQNSLQSFFGGNSSMFGGSMPGQGTSSGPQANTGEWGAPVIDHEYGFTGYRPPYRHQMMQYSGAIPFKEGGKVGCSCGGKCGMCSGGKVRRYEDGGFVEGMDPYDFGTADFDAGSLPNWDDYNFDFGGGGEPDLTMPVDLGGDVGGIEPQMPEAPFNPDAVFSRQDYGDVESDEAFARDEDPYSASPNTTQQAPRAAGGIRGDIDKVSKDPWAIFDSPRLFNGALSILGALSAMSKNRKSTPPNYMSPAQLRQATVTPYNSWTPTQAASTSDFFNRPRQRVLNPNGPTSAGPNGTGEKIWFTQQAAGGPAGEGPLSQIAEQGMGGQDDTVPAMLSHGEYVFDADTVAALGDGNSDAGAAKLDKMRENIRAHKRSAPVSEIPPKAHPPERYLKGKPKAKAAKKGKKQ